MLAATRKSTVLDCSNTPTSRRKEKGTVKLHCICSLLQEPSIVLYCRRGSVFQRSSRRRQPRQEYNDTPLPGPARAPAFFLRPLSFGRGRPPACNRAMPPYSLTQPKPCRLQQQACYSDHLGIHPCPCTPWSGASSSGIHDDQPARHRCVSSPF
jgi:hypothetical protein